eukprot:SAG31_NODE_921_length_10984_cov_2.779329_10_plen_253_part_00
MVVDTLGGGGDVWGVGLHDGGVQLRVRVAAAARCVVPDCNLGPPTSPMISDNSGVPRFEFRDGAGLSEMCGCACAAHAPPPPPPGPQPDASCHDVPGWADAEGRSCAFLTTHGLCTRNTTAPCCYSCTVAECVDDHAYAAALLGYQCVPATFFTCQSLREMGHCSVLRESGLGHVCGCSCADDAQSGLDMSQFANYSREFDPDVGKECYFLVFMGLFLLNLPYTHREIDCYFLVFMGLFALNLPCTHRETRD